MPGKVLYEFFAEFSQIKLAVDGPAVSFLPFFKKITPLGDDKSSKQIIKI